MNILQQISPLFYMAILAVMLVPLMVKIPKRAIFSDFLVGLVFVAISIHVIGASPKVAILIAVFMVFLASLCPVKSDKNSDQAAANNAEDFKLREGRKEGITQRLNVVAEVPVQVFLTMITQLIYTAWFDGSFLLFTNQ